MNIRKLARPAAALLAAAALMAGIPELRMEAQAAFPEYLKSVTYFGDAWPINYWGTEDDNMGANFARIKADGFNSIILVIPWREFQPGDMGNMYNEAAFAKLDQVMKCADDHGLMVTLRIGYCWDYSGEASLPERYAGVVQDGSNDRKMWIDYCKTIYDRVSDYGNFQGGFITWEDFWDYTSNMDRDLTRALSIRLASRCGYQDYLKAQLSSDFKIRTYPNGKVALNEILKNKPDLVISDIMMPEMDGTTLCAKLKSNINTNDVPIILLTAKSREEDQLEGLQTGADAYILKPFNMDILHRNIINLLTVRRTLRNKFTGNESQNHQVEQIEMQTPDNSLMQRIMEVINENINDSDLSVDMIAQKVGISRVHLHRKMKELTNQTPHSFIRNIRLQQAAKLLKDGKQSITEVMYACGFSNSASFSTMFKNLYGCSPREYMQNAMKK